MISYILWTLLLYFIYIAAHAVTRLSASKGDANFLAFALGPRDGAADASIGAARCGRAQTNMEEAMFFFMPLAFLLMLTDKADGIALTGALVFVVARAAYLPAYMIGLPALRTLVWAAGFAGIVMMVVRLHG
ncbi:MAG: MAPEG family protein [Marinicaulis sp.]|nr:MAPEG family protein [Marinicaulis sp.]NNE40862.1 MAPEG family protein [Marinicaulis sp.]NNL87808.1 MAPEG family protein [Marinicaulis sp.]